MSSPRLGAAFLILWGLCGLAGSAARADGALPDLSDWPAAAQAAATDMQKKYGPPQGVSATMLVWGEIGPWKRSIIHKQAVQHDFPEPHTDVLEQTLNYRVPADKVDELTSYNGSLVVARTRGELSVSSNSEPANFLTINLAHDILGGAKTVEEARDFHARTIHQVMDGDGPEYTRGFTFAPSPGQTADPDLPTLIE